MLYYYFRYPKSASRFNQCILCNSLALPHVNILVLVTIFASVCSERYFNSIGFASWFLSLCFMID